MSLSFQLELFDYNHKLEGFAMLLTVDSYLFFGHQFFMGIHERENINLLWAWIQILATPRSRLSKKIQFFLESMKIHSILD